MATLTAQTLMIVHISAQSESSGLTMALLERGLLLQYWWELLQAIQLPLSAWEKVPPEQDLTDHWERATMAVKGLGAGITPNDFMAAHIRNIGPFVLGTPVQGAVKNEAWEDWDGFWYLVEDQFGLTHLKIVHTFYAM